MSSGKAGLARGAGEADKQRPQAFTLDVQAAMKRPAGAPARLIVTLPADATPAIDGEPTTPAAARRVFVSGPILAGNGPSSARKRITATPASLTGLTHTITKANGA